MTVKVMRTAEYPTRNVAYANHGVWVEQTIISGQQGLECAAYYEPYENTAYNGVVDAIYIDITVCCDGIYCVNGYAVRPDVQRHEIKVSE